MSYDTVLKTIRKHNRKVFCYSTCRVFENDFDYIKIYCTPTPWVKKVCHYYFYDNCEISSVRAMLLMGVTYYATCLSTAKYN